MFKKKHIEEKHSKPTPKVIHEEPKEENHVERRKDKMPGTCVEIGCFEPIQPGQTHVCAKHVRT